MTHDVSLGYVRDGRYTGDMEDADEVAAFTPDGNHLATFIRADGGWTVAEAPGFAPDTLDPNRCFSTAEKMHDYLTQAMQAALKAGGEAR